MPAQNRVCERFVRTIKEMAECMLASSELGNRYWDYVMKEFGDHCFVHIPKEVQVKNSFDMAKVMKAQLLGFEKTGWVVLMENTNKIERSSDLVTAADTPFIIDKELPGKPMQVAAVPPSEAIMRKIMKFVDIKGDNVEDGEEDQEE
ncbi:hypothetical protein C355_05929 [Cryptococcus neoformans Th84]|nr:hypothetical protein C355_05929 [Cryptococcus neoformans var. grubii Th84]OXG48673.1 hypothetical protein C354_05973 [Cryptococcus neoformans var. grubii MW-RSA1955]OXH64908.1 hypothetical protein J000_05970 [Cryptococcus neoformans var. grubii]OXL10185.1 hypothetical protein C348_01919 [Cryptococcus neoformans var. grubii Gb118]